MPVKGLKFSSLLLLLFKQGFSSSRAMEVRWLGRTETQSLFSNKGTSSPKFRELIPGLPNELAMEVFLRLPAELHPAAMAASSLWRILLASRRFYVQRRLRFPYPSIILCRILDHPPYQGSYSVCEFLDFDLSFPSVAPRSIVTQAFLRLSRPLPCSVQNFTHRRLSASVPSANSATSVLLVNEGHLHRWMHFNITSLKLGYFLPQSFINASNAAFTFMGSLGSQIFMFHKDTCWSYDCCKHVWKAHSGLGAGFALDVQCRFSFQGHIYVRDVRNANIYAFDASISDWNLHMAMTQRLANRSCFVTSESSSSPSAFVVATPSATLISAFENFFVRERVVVEYQQAGTTEWCHFLEIKRGKGTKFCLLNKKEQVFLIVSDERSSFRHEVHHCDDFILTCIFVPFHLFINSFFFEG